MALRDQTPRSSHSFSCHTPARVDEVWDALTHPRRTPAYLHGLAVHSTWAVDSAVSASHTTGGTLTGHVVCCRPGERLSYLLRAEPSDPPIFLTWLLRPNAAGTTINLAVDEPDSPGPSEDAEDTWLPVLDALQVHLRGGEGAPPR